VDDHRDPHRFLRVRDGIVGGAGVEVDRVASMAESMTDDRWQMTEDSMEGWIED
jgi:hypothetical protein